MSDDETCTFEDAFRTRDMSRLIAFLERDGVFNFAMQMNWYWDRTHNDRKVNTWLQRFFWDQRDVHDEHADWIFDNHDALSVLFVLKRDFDEIDRVSKIAYGPIELMHPNWLRLGFLVAMVLQIDDMYDYLIPRMPCVYCWNVLDAAMTTKQYALLVRHGLIQKQINEIADRGWDSPIDLVRSLYQNALKLML